MVADVLIKEPLGFAGSMNFYVYADGDSVNFVDVSGLKPGDLFDTMDDAARDAHSYLFSLHPDPKIEYGTPIYLEYFTNPITQTCEQFYTYGLFQTQNDPDNVSTNYTAFPTIVALYHNHTMRDKHEYILTDTDLETSELKNLIYYMGKKDNSGIYKFIPSSKTYKDKLKEFPGNYFIISF